MPPDLARPDQMARQADWRTLKRFLPYLWPRDNAALRTRIVIAMVMVLAAKATTLLLPFAYKRAIDQMTTPANQAAMVALAFVMAYALGRFASVAFNNFRNIAFERVGQDATQTLARDVFAQLHRLSLRFHLSRRTGEVTKTIERGTKSIDTMLYFLLFNIAPTVIELIAVGVIFYVNFGWTLVIATAVAVVAYIAATRWITEWRTKLRMQMNSLDGQALSRAVDSLLNYETVKYFGAEHREEERYGRSARAYADAAVKSENSLGLLNIVQGFITNALMAGAMGYTVWGWSQGRLYDRRPGAGEHLSDAAFPPARPAGHGLSHRAAGPDRHGRDVRAGRYSGRGGRCAERSRADHAAADGAVRSCALRL